MEISSTNRMAQGMGMRPMGPPPGNASDHAEKMSSEIMKAQDADEDGLLSSDELESSDTLDVLDTDGDGFVSQAELEAGIKAKMEEAKSAFDIGQMPTEENRDFMNTMQSLSGMEMGGQRKATDVYSMMQENMFGGSQSTTAYNTDQLLLESLSITV